MIAAPKFRAAIDVLRSDLVFMPLALMYLVLLVRSWEPDTLSLMMPGSLREGFAGMLCGRNRCTDGAASVNFALPCHVSAG